MVWQKAALERKRIHEGGFFTRWNASASSGLT
jgi:hypothetical protein